MENQASSESSQVQVHFEMRYGQHYKMYTLWHVNHGSRFYNEHYIQNLGVDFEESLAKAKVLAHGHEVMIDAPDNLNSIARGEDVLRFGKYRDQHVADLTDEKYLLWLSRGASLPSKQYKDVWIESLERTSPIRIAAQNKCVDLGLLIWYNDRLMTVEGRDKLIARQNSQYIGEVGVKLDIEVTIEKINSYEGEYGTTWIYIMSDENGNVIVYKGSSYFIYDDENHNQHGFAAKDHVRIAGKVKSHTEYNGINQTYVQRIKMFKIN